MGFNFNPSLWFVCRFCRLSFANTETLKEHKLACHLGECVGVKCIVFEERLLTADWIPDAERDQLKNDFARETPFRNPRVSLTRLREQEHGGRKRRVEQRSSSSESCAKSNESELSADQATAAARNTFGTDPDPSDNSKFAVSKNDLIDPQTSSSNDNDESNFEKSTASQYKEASSNDPSDLANAIAKEIAQLLEDVEVSEFIQTKSSSNDEFPSTFIPAPEREVGLTLQQSTMISSNVIDPNSIIAESEHQQLIFNNDNDNEANALNSLANIDLNLNINNSKLSDTTSSKPMGEQEPETDESIPFHWSDLLRNFQIATSTTNKPVEKRFTCDTCSAVFRTRGLLTQHKLYHSSIKRFKCSKCPLEFKRNQELSRHQVKHGKETNFKCRFCAKSFSHNQSLAYHERSHTGDRPFKCPVANCDYAGPSKGLLTLHTRSKHSKELGLEQFVCPTCGKTYGVKKSLELHIHLHHSNVTPFRCTFKGCTMTFKLKDYLRRHLKTHT